MNRFFNAAFGDIPEGTAGLVWTLADKKSYWFTDPEAALSHASKQKADTYAGVGLAPIGRGPRERCTADELLGLVGFVSDIDICGPAHKKVTLPPDEGSARKLVEGWGYDPTIIVNSGHGLQAWWLFKEPWVFENAAENSKAKALSFRLHSFIKALAAEKGWNIDSVYDLARVMRVPDTWNCKNGTKIKSRIIVFDNLRRYDPADFDEFLPPAEEPKAEPVKIGQALKLDPAARVSMSRFGTAAMIEPRLEPTWEGKRPDLASGSEHDLSLAALLVGCGWEDQEIADAIIHRRREFNDNPEKALRADYVTKTILKARSGHAERTAIEGLGEALAVSDTPYEPEDNKQRLLDLISKRLRIKVIRVIRYIPEPFVYAIETPRGIHEIGKIENLIMQNRLQARLADSAKHYIPTIKGSKDDPGSGWGPIATAFLAVLEDVAVTDEHSQEDETNAWLHDFFQDFLQTNSILDISSALSSSQGAFTFEGERYISFSPFKRWLAMALGEMPDNKSVARRLTAAGCEFKKISYQVNGKQVQKRAWRIPAYDAK